MNKEFQYLQQIFQHIEDYSQGKQDLIEDLSCADCYSEDQNLGLLENPRFREFWQFVILPRYPDIQTIRYTVIPVFDTLVETIQFYRKENQKKTDNNDESSGSSQPFGGTGFTPNDEKDKQKAKTSGSSNKWDTGTFSTYKPYSGTGLSSNLKPFVNTKPFQNSFSSPSIRTSTYLLDFFEPRESRLVDFPVFKGGNRSL
ncbi:unnamed protein product [Rhizophagus irregularis]|nr:unnamed protein product [Rhizophagus irregularis]